MKNLRRVAIESFHSIGDEWFLKYRWFGTSSSISLTVKTKTACLRHLVRAEHAYVANETARRMLA